MKPRERCVSSTGLVLISLLSTMITAGCGSSRVSSQVAPTQNPLVAQYNVVPTASASGAQSWVEFGPTTSYGRQTSSVSPIQRGFVIPILVAGMKPSTTYHMRAHVIWPDGTTWVDQDHTFTTGALPAALTPPGITVTEPTPGLSPAPGVELLSLNEPSGTNMLQSVVTDLQGNIIWYYQAGAFPIKLLPNGHLILNTDSDLREIDLAGNTIRDVSVAQVNQALLTIGRSFTIINFSHDVLVLPNGHWITIGQISQNYTDLPGYPGVTAVLGDVVVDIDTAGNVVWAWSAFDYLDVNRHPFFGLPDWTHSNALVYTADGNLLLSMRAQSWILKLDYANGSGSGNILWKLGEDGDFTITGGDPSQWFYAQHYPNILSVDGTQSTMAVYDDGNYRLDVNGVSCGSSPAPACYSRATIFQIDETTDVATLLWQDLPGFFSSWGGSIGTLGNGDVEFANSAPVPSPSTSSIFEVTPNENSQVVWQMNINGENAYRGYRIPSLYPGIIWNQ